MDSFLLLRLLNNFCCLLLRNVGGEEEDMGLKLSDEDSLDDVADERRILRTLRDGEEDRDDDDEELLECDIRLLRYFDDVCGGELKIEHKTSIISNLSISFSLLYFSILTVIDYRQQHLSSLSSCHS